MEEECGCWFMKGRWLVDVDVVGGERKGLVGMEVRGG